MKSYKKDYMFRGWLLAVAVTAGVVALGFIPQTEVFGIDLSRVDIFASLRSVAETEEFIEYEADIQRLEEELAAVSQTLDTLEKSIPVRYEWIVAEAPALPRARLRSDAVLPDTTRRIIPIEDFDTAAYTRIDRLVAKLAVGEPVRIAFMGDSFVEGDIVTVDLRNYLQRLFGGRGVGFVPCDIPFATARKSVKRTSKGWSSYSIMKPKAAPETLRDLFFVSGYISNGTVGASTRWQSVDTPVTLDSCNVARLLLVSRESSSVELTLNDTLSHRVDIEGSEQLREIRVEAPVHSLAVKVKEGSVLCYGLSLEDTGGVTVDNFSVRSNNGHAIFGTSAAINRQADEMLGYDLVVLQYGLNIMNPNQRNFSKYRDQLCDMIAYVERCFPEAAVLVLGVSDRWIKSEETGDYVPIGSVDALTAHQRAAADSLHVAFWNTSEAMMQHGGMRGFVANGWAASDHTHINYAGGRRIAESLAAAIQQLVYAELCERERGEVLLRDSLLRAEQQREERITERIDAVTDVINPVLFTDGLPSMNNTSNADRQ